MAIHRTFDHTSVELIGPTTAAVTAPLVFASGCRPGCLRPQFAQHLSGILPAMTLRNPPELVIIFHRISPSNSPMCIGGIFRQIGLSHFYLSKTVCWSPLESLREMGIGPHPCPLAREQSGPVRSCARITPGAAVDHGRIRCVVALTLGSCFRGSPRPADRASAFRTALPL